MRPTRGAHERLEVIRSRSDVGSQTSRFPVVSAFNVNGAMLRKQPVLPTPDTLYTDTTYAQYDLAGNAIRSGAVFQRPTTTGDRYYTATRNYYAADNRLVVAQKYHATDAGRSGAWEEFRYDALGRRVLSRSRRGGNGNPQETLCSGEASACNGYVERTLWDGDQVLYELRANGSDDRTPAQLDALTSVGPIWGKAGYVHAGGIDRPLVTMDGRVPTYNWRGLPESSTWTDGAKADCSLGGSGCVLIAWPASNSVYLKAPPAGSGGSGATPQWVGTVLQDGAGSTGMLYRRNRYYDPGTGQFTQQDPIGIAGGLNVYGFAGGDPINFSDPFGLCPEYLTGRPCNNVLGGGPMNIRTSASNPQVGEFGMVRDEGTRAHQGLDILARVGTSVTASDEGTVVFAGVNGDHGNQVVIGHKNADGKTVSYTSYSHLSSISVSSGDAVTSGASVGTTGKTGNANRPDIPAHLHFEIRTANPPGRGLQNRVDPKPELKP